MPANPTYNDGSQATARAVSAFVKEPAFEGVNELLIGRQDFVQARASYTPLALGTPHPDDADFLLAKEDNFQDLGEDIRQWTRTYAKVPDRRIEGRAIAWTLPGLAAGGINPFYTITAVTAGTSTVSFETSAAHGLTSADTVVIYFGQLISKYVSQFKTYQIATVTGPTTFTCPLVAVPPLAQTNAQFVQFVDPVGIIPATKRGRNPRSQTVRGFVVFDYYESIDGADIALLLPPVIIDANQQVTDTYDVATDPSLVDYLAAIDEANDPANSTFDLLYAAGALVVASPSTPRRWQGNIWERETEYVLAQ